MQDLWIVLVIGFACATQSLAGFGLALVAMPFLSILSLAPSIATPLIAVVGFILRPALVLRSWRSAEWRELWRFMLGAGFGVPIGVFIVHNFDEQILVRALGALVLAYVAYEGLIVPRLAQSRPRLGTAWAYPLGLAAGIFGGVYNIFGPPAIIFGMGRAWQSQHFRANLQIFAMWITLLNIGAHFLDGNFSPEVLRLALLCVPAAFGGLWLGIYVERYLSEVHYTRLILILLSFTGLRLLLT